MTNLQIDKNAGRIMIPSEAILDDTMPLCVLTVLRPGLIIDT